jgi:hypothetical protein
VPGNDVQIGRKGNEEEDCLLLFVPEGELLQPSAPVHSFVSDVAEPPAPVGEPTRPRRRAPIVYPDTSIPTRPRPLAITATAVSVAIVVLLFFYSPDTKQPQPSLPPAPSLTVASALRLAPPPAPALAPPTALPAAELPASVATTGATKSLAARPRAAMPRAQASSRKVATAKKQSTGHVGTLSVQSLPQGASVFINNEYAGQTPLVLRAVPAGSRAVRLRLDGYDAWSRGVRVVANQSTTVKAQLNTMAVAP